MDRSEAFKTLGLPSTATPLELKQRYRDLAKVWHPDRFGADPRLRHKAEETLKGINEAYQLLRSGATPRPTRPAPSTTPRRTSPSSPPPRQTAPRKTRAHQTTRPTAHSPITTERPRLFWTSRSLLLSVALGFIWIATSLSSPKVTAPPDTNVLALPERAVTVAAGSTVDSSPTKPLITVSQNEDIPAEQSAASSLPAAEGLTEGQPPPDAAIQTPTARPTSARATPKPREERESSEISEPERQSIEAVCSSTKYLEGPAAYTRCLRTQLVQLRSTSSRPDLSALSGPEQQSIEAVCSTAKYLEGPAAYNRCLRTQLAQLGSTSSRPYLSGLSQSEQQSIEAVCSKAKYIEGPRAYNRCLRTQLAQLGSASSRPDLSALSQPEQQSIEAACFKAKYLDGPAAYNRCLIAQLRPMRGRD